MRKIDQPLLRPWLQCHCKLLNAFAYLVAIQCGVAEQKPLPCKFPD